MININRPRSSAFTPAQVTGFYFRPRRDDNEEVIAEYFRCRCGTVRKQIARNGFSNLMQHVQREHPDYEAVMVNNLPLHFCENPAARRYSNLDPICVGTLLSAMDRLTWTVERTIAAEIPDQFGLIFDGWSHASEHFVAVFACYEVDRVTSTPLLSMAPLLNVLDDDLSAQGHYDFMATMLPRDYDRPPSCDSTGHTLELEALNGASLLCNKRLLSLLKSLKKVESVAKVLQGKDVTLLDVRVWFDGLIAIKPHFAHFLGPRADIVPNPDFEAGCVRILDGKASRLTRAEKVALEPFRCSPRGGEEKEVGCSSDDESSFVAQLQKRRRVAAVVQRYVLLGSIPASSNITERFFSVARTTFEQERHRLNPITLEMVLFLRQNNEYWSTNTVDEATK
ncbi:hypothetical protein PHMEG_00016401 [Phytophthora megakarya]|uniref:HAT C-terminal dimerisation domain-containing protein n=1 Tax=Phytophthora megakarya TaxID=4795 RepID=A0A225VZ41_9STRA|nr:hypothetical protein PHMEG_00016401 [Phytophthora megakarya]